jgi:hypothetical protein
MDVKTVRLGLLVLVVVAAIGFGLFAVLGDDDEDEGASDAPVALSESELVAAAADFSHPAYWIGPIPETTDAYELTNLPDGRIYVRYLTDGAEAGDERPNFLTIGTYSKPDAVTALEETEEAGGTKGLSEEDGFTMLKGGSGLNAYVVFDDQPDLQVEVYAPGPGDAVELIEAGALKPVG